MKRNAKRVLAHFLAVVMLLSCLSALFVGGTVTASAASVYDASKGKTLPTPVDNVYTIQTANQFMAFADTLNGGNNFSGKTIKLDCDIVINPGAYGTWGNNPIAWSGNGGSWGNRFAGSFDGQGHTISGLYNKNTETASNQSGNAGLFGRVVGGTEFKNVNIVNSYFGAVNGYNGSNGVGGLIGNIDPNWAAGTTTISNVHIEAVLESSGSEYQGVGGIVGSTAEFDSHSLVIQNCSFKGTINAGSSTKVGGIVGFVKSGTNFVMENCSADAAITCGNMSAALAGRIDLCNARISNCLAKVSITSSAANISALIGYIKSDSESVAVQVNNVLLAVSGNIQKLITTMYGGSANYTATFGLENIVYDSTLLSSSIGWIRRDGSNQMYATVNGAESVKSSNWDLEAQYEHDKKWYNFDITAKESTELKGQKVFDFWTAVPNDYPTPPTTSVPSIYRGVKSYAYDQDDTAKTITLYTAGQLMGFANRTGSNNFQDYTIKLANDMVINQGDASAWATSAPSYDWACFYTKGTRLLGTFDGQGHTISGVYSKKADHVGLFKIVGQDSTIKNLNVVNSYFEGTETWGDVGGLIGYLYGEGDTETGTYTITNVSVDAIVKGKRHVGGLIGGDEGAYLNKATTTNITNCAFSGTVSCSDGNVGGLVGWACATKNFDGCSVKGTLAASGAYVGGLIGYIYRGVSTTSVSASNCNVKAEISGSEQLGGLFGRIADVQSVTISNCLAKSDITPSITSNTTTAGLIGAYNTGSGVATASISNTLISVRGEYVTAVVVSHWGSQKLTLTLNTVKYDSNRFNGSRARDAYKSNETNFACTTNTTGVTFANIKGTAVFSSGWTAVPGNYPVPTSAKEINSSKIKAFQSSNPTELIGYQTKQEVDGTYTIRLIATFKNGLSTNYLAAGFKNVKITLDNGASKTQSEWYCKKAYRSVIADGTTFKASEYCADAFIFLTFKGVPSEVSSIEATPFVTTSKNGTVTSGDSANWNLKQATISTSAPILKVMSLNMNLNYSADPDGSGSGTAADRRAGIQKQIIAQAPDIICFQEDGWSATQINNLMKSSNLNGLSYSVSSGSVISTANSGSNKMYQRIYYNSSKFTLAASGQRSLSNDPSTVPNRFSGYSNDDKCRPRGFNYAKLTLKSNTSKSFYVFNVHLENANSEKRRNEVESLISQVKSIAGSTPYMLCGDFNLITHYDVDSNDATAKAQLKEAYEDSRLIADFTETFGTYIDADIEVPGNKVFGTSYTTSGKGNIIDYCFVSKNKFHVYSYDVISERQTVDGHSIYTSDHLPIVVQMSLI